MRRRPPARDPYEKFILEADRKKGIVWRKCPKCGDEIRDLIVGGVMTAGGFETHWSASHPKAKA